MSSHLVLGFLEHSSIPESTQNQPIPGKEEEHTLRRKTKTRRQRGHEKVKFLDRVDDCECLTERCNRPPASNNAMFFAWSYCLVYSRCFTVVFSHVHGSVQHCRQDVFIELVLGLSCWASVGLRQQGCAISWMTARLLC